VNHVSQSQKEEKQGKYLVAQARALFRTSLRFKVGPGGGTCLYIQALQRLRQEGPEFKANLGYITRP
jgi:hypothetical protein